MANDHVPSDLSPPLFSANHEPRFMGYHRADGRVGTRNYWLVIPLFAGEEQPFSFLKDALLAGMGYIDRNPFLPLVRNLQEQYRAGSYFETVTPLTGTLRPNPVFPAIDGVKFLPPLVGPDESVTAPHSVWEVVAGYCSHPNVGGITVLSGNETSHIDLLRSHINKRDPQFVKTMLVVERQRATTFDWFAQALRETFRAMAVASKQTRRPAPLSSLIVGIQPLATNTLADEVSGLAHYGRFLAGAGASIIGVHTDNAHPDQPGRNRPFNDSVGWPKPGLSICCLPGTTAERTTTLTAAGCTLHLTTNDVGLPVGNHIAPVSYLSTRPPIADWFDIDGSTKISPDPLAQTLLHHSLRVASGQQRTEAENRRLEHFDISEWTIKNVEW